MELLFATHNRHKLTEVSQLLPAGIHLVSLTDIGFSGDIPETAATIEENASMKTAFVYNKTGLNCFADDSGLEIDSLGGAPGVLSARYAGEQRSDADNVQKVLAALSGNSNRRARFKTVISLLLNGKEKQFTGIIEGSITHSPAGNQGFGYDPVFIPEGYKITFAQMSAEEKNRISHRALAVGKLVNFLREQ